MVSMSSSTDARVPRRESTSLRRRARSVRPGRDVRVGLGVAFGTLLLATAGIDNALNYDEAVTVGLFVKAPTAVDSVTRQVVFNNHPLISLLDHFVYASMGQLSEPALRVIPIMAFVVAAALIAYQLSRWWGPAAGLAGGFIFATNPLVYFDARAVRGYSLLLLMAVASTLVLIKLARDKDAPTLWLVAYVVLASLGLMAHLYMLFVLGAQFTAGLVVPELRRRRLPVCAVMAGIVGMVLQYHLLVAPKPPSHSTRLFRPSLPLWVARDLLGTSTWAIAAGGVLIVLGIHLWWRRVPFVAITVVVAAESALVWVVAPVDLYTRFFVWLVPAVTTMTVAGAVHVGRRRDWWRLLGWAGCLVIIGAQLLMILPTAERSMIANRSAAAVLTRTSQAGASVCVLATSWEALDVYYDAKPVKTKEDFGSCDLIAAIAPFDAPLVPLAEQTFRNQLRLTDSTISGVIYTNADVQCLQEDQPPPTCWAGSG
jgi:hypothetical protein